MVCGSDNVGKACEHKHRVEVSAVHRFSQVAAPRPQPGVRYSVHYMLSAAGKPEGTPRGLCRVHVENV